MRHSSLLQFRNSLGLFVQLQWHLSVIPHFGSMDKGVRKGVIRLVIDASLRS